ncbi:radical SAM family RiPP maturation amino acid epimerase [Verrucomicrobia bacterium]|jgi:radical SAM family RiPP maturation amino acid epimerase|nr:radical SAM family RiPP maturation amino acid epimerase [Verrucomicrobiota bacterium]
MQDLDNPTVAETKRFLELYTGIQSYKDEVDANCNITQAPFGFRFKPSSVRSIYDADYLESQQKAGIGLNTAEKAYREFCNQKIGWRNRIRYECTPADDKLGAWRKRQINRSKFEFGAQRDQFFIHAPLMFELAEGCSVGCWFCAFSASKLAKILPYSPENIQLWRGVLHAGMDVIGPAARWSTDYFATDPLDNPEHEEFCRDFHEIMGMWPQTTTAIAHKDVERVRALLLEAREAGCRVNRFSVITTKNLERIHNAFTAEELRDVEIIAQSQDSTFLKAKAGRYIDTAQKSKKIEDREAEKNVIAFEDKFSHEEAAKLAAEMEDQAGSICCVSGFLVNMVERSIKLISPVGADERWPLGMIVYDQAEFKDDKDFPKVLQTMQNRIKLKLDMDDIVQFNTKAKVELLEDGFQLKSASTLVSFTKKGCEDVLRYIGELISEGTKSANEICLLSFYKTSKPMQFAMGILQELFNGGFINEDPKIAPKTYYKDGGPQMIGELNEEVKTAREMIDSTVGK